MISVSNEAADRRLLDAIQSFVVDHADPAIQRFKDGVAHWGEEWIAVPPRHLPVADVLASTLALAVEATRDLMILFEREKTTRQWEQSYNKADGAVGEDMLAGYGFAEVIGRHGPFVSTRVRAGIGVWGPGIHYPPHRHEAEEVYLLLAGQAEFRMGAVEDAKSAVRRAGEVVYVPSMQTHGFLTKAEPLVVFYIWQAGDLREKSSFV